MSISTTPPFFTLIPLLINLVSGSGLAKAGPAGVLIDYSVIGVIVFMVMAALGEMTSMAPMSRESSM